MPVFPVPKLLEEKKDLSMTSTSAASTADHVPRSSKVSDIPGLLQFRSSFGNRMYGQTGNKSLFGKGSHITGTCTIGVENRLLSTAGIRGLLQEANPFRR